MSNKYKIIRATGELNAIVAQGHLVYRTATQLLALREVVRTWIDDLGVEVVFAPDTPADLQSYLLGTSIGAMEGAFAGALVGLALGAMFSAPWTGLAAGAVGGGALGAAQGAAAVAGGYRVRIRAWQTIDGPVALVEAA